MKNYKTIKALHEAIKSGEIDESQLSIVLDNDCTCFYIGPTIDKNGNEINNEIEVEEANGYNDIEALYSLFFPKSLVEWC